MKLAIIGSGQMGQALVRAFAGNFENIKNIAVYDVDQGKAEVFAEEIGCDTLTVERIDEISGYDAVLLAVKPQIMAEAAAFISRKMSKKALVISIAAGISLEQMYEMGFYDQALVRVMPNTPALVSSAVSALTFGDNVSKEQKTWVMELFNACGLAFEIPEKLMDAVTGLSGSGPAYMMLVMEAMADGGVRQGLPRDLAIQMAAMTMLGSAKLVLETKNHPGLLKDQVCSPAGTTIEAVSVLENNKVRSAFIEAVKASAERSKELGN